MDALPGAGPGRIPAMKERAMRQGTKQALAAHLKQLFRPGATITRIEDALFLLVSDLALMPAPDAAWELPGLEAPAGINSKAVCSLLVTLPRSWSPGEKALDTE